MPIEIAPNGLTASGLSRAFAMRMQRRKFLIRLAGATGLAAGAGTWWAAVSERRSARLIRRIVDDSRREVASAPFHPELKSFSDNKITCAWLGHATVWINFYGLKILTDPAFGSRIGVSIGIGTVGLKRYVASAVTLRELPPVDLMLLSHAHMDHMDMGTLRRVPGSPLVISAAETGDLIPKAHRSRLAQMKWGDRQVLKTANGDIEVAAFEVKHWGQRWPNDIERGYNGYILKREGKSLLFGGDTAMTDLFQNLRSGSPFEAAIMPIGAYRPWIRNHCTPEEALEMVNAAGAKYVLPVHHKTFKLSEEPFEEPIERMEAALAHEPERLAWKDIGATFTLPTG